MKTTRLFKSTYVTAVAGDVQPPDADHNWRLVNVVPVAGILGAHEVAATGAHASAAIGNPTALLAFWEADPHVSISLGG